MNRFTGPNLYVTTEKGNNYLISSAIPQFLLLNPISHYLLELRVKGTSLEDWLNHLEESDIEIEPGLKTNKQELNYYYNYLLFLERNNYFKEVKTYEMTAARYDAKSIEYELANTIQIVFECTSACGLQCKYCGYGDLYSINETRQNKKLDIVIAKKLFDYLVERFESPLNRRIHEQIAISFYGGEPLLNMPFIEEMVAYVKSKNSRGRQFFFTMTSNGMDLDKHMDFIAANEFHLLISLDGNEEHNSHRVKADGVPSFETVFNNILALKERHPAYYEKWVRFNAVLHNKNSHKEVTDFFTTRLGKTPQISQVSAIGIKPEKKAEFDAIFKKMYSDLTPQDLLNDIQDKEKILKTAPVKQLAPFLFQNSGFHFKSYNRMLNPVTKARQISTGTCNPFGRKIFLTAEGKILACEKILQDYCLGSADEKGVHIDFQEVADKYNAFYGKLMQLCNRCSASADCSMCIFMLNLLDDCPSCPYFKTSGEALTSLRNALSLLEETPKFYPAIMRDYQEQ
jgi:uncharacterized protein